MKVTRRRFLTASAALGALAVLDSWRALSGLLEAAEVPPDPVRLPAGLGILSRAEWLAIAYIADAVLPPTPESPSAVEAGALGYMSRLLGARASRYKSAYRRAARTLDAAARRGHGRAFADLDEVRKREAVVGWIEGPGRSDFEILRRHAIEGYLSRPEHGGNAGGAGWKALRHVCQPHYPDLDAPCP